MSYVFLQGSLNYVTKVLYNQSYSCYNFYNITDVDKPENEDVIFRLLLWKELFNVSSFKCFWSYILRI